MGYTHGKRKMTALVDISRCPTLLLLAGPKPILALPPPRTDVDTSIPTLEEIQEKIESIRTKFPNSVRVPPSEVPKAFHDFNGWSHFACCEWPPSLTADAYYAKEALKYKQSDAKHLLEKFLRDYEKWFRLPEREKFSHLYSYSYSRSGFDHSPDRLRYLEQARDIARRARS